MSMQDLFVYIIVAGCVLWAGRRFLRQEYMTLSAWR